MVDYLTTDQMFLLQAFINTYTKHNPFTMNGKMLEIPMSQGAMAIDQSRLRLARAVAMTGAMGTFALTKSGFKKEYAQLNLANIDGIIGVNSLVGIDDFKDNYGLAQNINSDFIVMAAAASREAQKKIIPLLKEQRKWNTEDNHLWGVQIFSDVTTLLNKIRKPFGYLLFENGDAGGHNGPGSKGFYDTLYEFADKGGWPEDRKGNKVGHGGGITNPHEWAMVLNAGFDIAQFATIYAALAAEADTSQLHRFSLINAKEGDYDSVASNTGLPASGSTQHGAFKSSLDGVNSPKRPCHGKESGCMKDCDGERNSAILGGIIDKDSERHIGTYCLPEKLENVHTNPDDSAMFGSKRAHELPLKEMLKGREEMPAAEIIGTWTTKLAEIIHGSSQTTFQVHKKLENHITDDFKRDLNREFRELNADQDPRKLTGKIFQNSL